MAMQIGNHIVMQLLNLCGRACKRGRSEHSPNIVVRRNRAVEVDGEEKRLGDSYPNTDPPCGSL